MQLSNRVDRVLEALEQTGFSISSFLSSFISLKQYKNHDAMAELLLYGSELLDTLCCFLNENDNSDLGLCSASEIMVATYAREICEASAQANGSHFNVSHTSLSQLEEFLVDELAGQMEEHAPQFWRLLGVLLDARNRQNMLDEDMDQNMEPQISIC
ncbi:hypothetical protein PAXRUDRAFT_150136 [Paxillus rubicundulus Ve08.2h10]|uniref:Unplaced genomic scaffold scaffold_599, whole genome shotgun sequence n=1 Tax=Paxillus rubicundulus Ve08.2h10 TaxID=930991 RepID=A0A0D0DJA0_9AGAM|nr:hypothetical protein PAXRUDRAFT_150136 [Paxillus rubicundulus Ve08.2h10]